MHTLEMNGEMNGKLKLLLEYYKINFSITVLKFNKPNVSLQHQKQFLVKMLKC